MRVLDPRQRRGLARHQPFGEMLQPCERQIGEDEPVRGQFLEETDFLDLLLEAFGALARRHGTQPFDVADLTALDGRRSRDTSLALGRRYRRSDGLEQSLLVVPPRHDHLPPDVPLTEQEIMMLDQPDAGRAIRSSWSNTTAVGEDRPRARARHGGEHGTSEQPERCLMMLEQGPGAGDRTPGPRRSAAARNRGAGRDDRGSPGE